MAFKVLSSSDNDLKEVLEERVDKNSLFYRFELLIHVGKQ